MTEKSKTWRSSTTTHSWSMSGGTSADAGDAMDALRHAGNGARTRVSEQWSYVGDDADGPYRVEIKDGVVTLNGRRYDSLDAVPQADRERIEALRTGLNDSGLWDALRDAGVDIGGLAGTGRQDRPTSRHSSWKRIFRMCAARRPPTGPPRTPWMRPLPARCRAALAGCAASCWSPWRWDWRGGYCA